jgi:hypothetical protein
MTSSQSRYSLNTAPVGRERLLVGDEWRFLAEKSLQLRQSRKEMPRAAAIGIGIVLGTGAMNPALTAPITSCTPGVVVSAQQFESSRKFEVLTCKEQIVAIRSLLGLNISELAGVLRVQRPTVYSWQAGTAEPHPDNGNRLRRTYEFALRWSRLCSEPLGEWVRKPLDENGRTLVALLSDESANDILIAGAFTSLKARLEEEARGFTDVSERARKFGYKERSTIRQDSAANRETLV